MQKLYDELMALCSTSDTSKFFFNTIHTFAGTRARVFSYNYASYSDWIKPGALECRGIMFEIDEADKPVRIMARPMEKFFNLNETPFTMNLDFSKVEYVASKADGSLISSYVDKGNLYVKSKTSIDSDQSNAAASLIRSDAYNDLYNRLMELGNNGYTVNMEYVSPRNRIVLAYQEPQLIILNVRHNETGDYVPFREIHADPALRPYMGDLFAPEDDFESFVKKTYDTEDIEGFVVYMSDGMKFKLKTNWYVALHRTKDSITKNSELFAVISTGGADDLQGMFFDDPASLAKINAFNEVFLETIGRFTREILAAYEKLRHLERRDYAIQGQQIFKEKFLFGPLMQIFGNGSHETVVKQSAELFLKNYHLYVPDQYK